MNIQKKIRDLLPPSVQMTFTNYAFKLVFKFLLLLFVPKYLSESEMGFWYTFISIAALTTFADLGFTSIITQFSAHEAVNVSFDKKTRNFNNSDIEISQISSLFRFSIRWSGLLTIACSIAILSIGMLIFGREKGDAVAWVSPWIIYAISSSLNFFNQVVLAFFEGCNQIVTSQKIKLINGIIANGLGVLGLSRGWGLMALAMPMLLSITVSFIQIFIYYGHVIARMLRNGIQDSSIWLRQILKLLWKYAISWISGYLVFQIYNPLVFAKFGSEMAGKVGYLLTIISAFVSIANVWSYVSVPQINMLTEKREWMKLDSVFKKNLILIDATFLLEVFCCLLLFKLPYLGAFVSSYIFSVKAFLCLSVGYSFQLATSYIGVYLRSHKEEPLMILSVLTAIISLFLTFISIQFLSVEYVFLGFLISVTCMFPFVVRVKMNKTLEWHKS